MNGIKVFVLAAGVVFCCGCSTLKDTLPNMDADTTAQAFFNRLQVSDLQGAYSLLGKGLCQRVSYDQFEQFMQTLHDKWGRLVSDETETLPFHRRVGEENFIPLHVPAQNIRRYVYEVKYDSGADINFDLTLAPLDEGGYKIVWFSVWGSSIYFTPEIQKKIEELFTAAEEAPEQDKS